MLSPASRLRHASDFSEVVRRGRRVSRPLVTVHLLTSDEPSVSPPRAGLVVSKAVGGSVVRSRTARRLRHLLRDRLAGLPAGARLVVRAGARAGTASSVELGADLDSALPVAVRPRSTGARAT